MCTLCPAGAFHDTQHHTEVSLALFSTFEQVNLTPSSVMQREGVPMFYGSTSSSALPSLYICPVKNVLGSVPLMMGLIPCFVEGNTSPTIPHRFGSIGWNVLRGVAADSRPDAGNGRRRQPPVRTPSWMLRCGRGQAQGLGRKEHGGAGQASSRGAGAGERNCEAAAAGGSFSGGGVKSLSHALHSTHQSIQLSHAFFSRHSKR